MVKGRSLVVNLINELFPVHSGNQEKERIKALSRTCSSKNSMFILNFLAGFHLSQNSRLIFTYNKFIDNVIFPDVYGTVLNFRFENSFER